MFEILFDYIMWYHIKFVFDMKNYPKYILSKENISNTVPNINITDCGENFLKVIVNIVKLIHRNRYEI